MNTRLTHKSPAGYLNRFSRAAFSPVRSTPTSPSDVPSTTSTAPAADAPAFRPPALDGADFPRVESPRPTWHRGPLDRLRPVLTRYRD